MSGRGSNFEALADSVASGRIPNAEIAIVISNREGAPGIERAKARGIATRVIPSKGLEREIVRSPGRRRLERAKSRPGLSGRLHAAAFALFCGCVSEPYPEYSPIAAAFVSGPRIAAPSTRLRRQVRRMHGAFCGRKSGRGPHRSPSRCARKRQRHGGGALRHEFCKKNTEFIPKPFESSSKAATKSKAAASFKRTRKNV